MLVLIADHAAVIEQTYHYKKTTVFSFPFFQLVLPIAGLLNICLIRPATVCLNPVQYLAYVCASVGLTTLSPTLMLSGFHFQLIDLSTHLPICLSIYVCLSVCLYCISVCVSLCLSVSLSVCQSACLSLSRSVWLSLCLPVYLSVSVCLSVRLSVFLSVCLFDVVAVFSSVIVSMLLVLTLMTSVYTWLYFCIQLLLITVNKPFRR